MKKNILPVEQSREYLLSMLEKGTKSAADTGGTDTASGGYGAARSKKQKVAALIRPELTIPAGAETDADTGGYWDEEADARYDAFLKDYEKTTVPAGAETDARTDGGEGPLSGEQKLDAKIAAKLPESFPVDEWETLTTKQQLKAMQFSGLTNEEQWRLLNASMPLKELVRAQEKEKEQIRAALKAALEETSEDAETQQSGRSGGTLSGAGGGRGIGDTGTDSSKLPPLQQRILDRQLEEGIAAPQPGPLPETTPQPTSRSGGTVEGHNTVPEQFIDTLSKRVEDIDTSVLTSGEKHLLKLACAKLEAGSLTISEYDTVSKTIQQIKTKADKKSLLSIAMKTSTPDATWDTSMVINQKDYSSTAGTFGEKGSIAGNGCGFIAIHNTNQLLGDKTGFGDTYYELNSHSGQTTLKSGKAGMNPLTVGQYYKGKGYDVTFYIDAELNEVPKSFDAYIMLYEYKYNAITETGEEEQKTGAHYIAIQYDKDSDQFIAYNNRQDKPVQSENNLEGFIPVSM